MTQEITSSLEKHIQTVLTVVAAGLIGWIGISVSDQATGIALLQQDMTHVKDRFEEFANRPHFTEDDFLIAMQPIKNKILKNANDIAILKKQVCKLEDDVYVEYVNPRKKVSAE